MFTCVSFVFVIWEIYYKNYEACEKVRTLCQLQFVGDYLYLVHITEE